MSATALVMTTAQKESIWRERIARQKASGNTIAAFCEQENLGKSTFSYWCRRLGVAGATPARKCRTVGAAFVDAGPIKAVRLPEIAGVEVHLELGGGVVLHIARR